jgi:hypothetical protein
MPVESFPRNLEFAEDRNKYPIEHRGMFISALGFEWRIRSLIFVHSGLQAVSSDLKALEKPLNFSQKKRADRRTI